ncbi:hypothetical protein SLEP1_g37732 [Rubroshorea leprosula]|uniref:PGG domain-containing protein n=1 Tax=Rubroshorea leprosula TaxID=152421 RepID=A0AAV5KW62_9ROSI|nr:hypothetical protein SLEP1_g37732 [Rubroshorea leprosula]
MGRTFPPITDFVETVLQVAVRAEQDEIAKKLAKTMSKADLEKKDCNGHTVLSYVAFQGRTNLAKFLVLLNRDLLTIVDNAGNIPLTRACGFGHKEMAYYLYEVTPCDLLEPGKEGNHGFHLMRCCIANKMFGLKVELPTIPTTPTKDIQLDVADQGYVVERNIGKRVFNGLRGLGLKVQEFFGIKQIYDLKLRHRYACEVLHCMCNHVSAFELTHQHDDYGVGALLFEATKHGIVEFVIELCKANPSFGFKTNNDGRLAFMVAVQHRQEKVFNLIYGANEAWKAENLNKLDKDGNNILHMAGALAPDFKSVGICSPALQMQKELQWFKEVERIVPEWCKEAKNNNGDTPKDVFTESHKALVKDGARWMTETASSFIILSILLVTIMFAVSFTVPGGDNQNNGLPILLGKKLFKIFIITDAISFFAASTSGLIFLGILTSRKAEEDFLLSLPRKLMIGLITLFISIATMMASFSAALLIMLQVQLWALILITLAAVIPTMVFGWLQFPLICEIIVSTCSQGIFNRKMKPWLVNLQ